MTQSNTRRNTEGRDDVPKIDWQALLAEHDRWLAGLIAAGLRESRQAQVARRADVLAVLEIAAADGLAMQVLSDPAGFDPGPSCAMLEHLMGGHAPSVEEESQRSFSSAG